MSMVIRPEQVLARTPALTRIADSLAEDGYMDSAGEVFIEPLPPWYSR